MLPNKLYDWLKWIALVALDALGICYQTLAEVWGWPYGDQVLQTCCAVSVLIGALIGISTGVYNRRENADMSEDDQDE